MKLHTPLYATFFKEGETWGAVYYQLSDNLEKGILHSDHLARHSFTADKQQSLQQCKERAIDILQQIWPDQPIPENHAFHCFVLDHHTSTDITADNQQNFSDMEQVPKRVVWVTEQPYVGGAQWHVAYLAYYMRLYYGIESLILFSTDRDCQDNNILNWLDSHAVRYRIQSREDTKATLDEWFLEKAAAFNPDIVYFSWIYPIPRSLLTGNWKKYLLFGGPDAASQLDDYIADRLDAILGVSDAMRFHVQSRYRHKYRTSLAGIPSFDFLTMEAAKLGFRAKFRLPDQTKVVIWVGRLGDTVAKRSDILREVIRTTSEERDDVFFLVCGGYNSRSTAARAEWDAFASQTPNLHIEWNMKPWDAPRFMNCGDIYLCTSDKEGLSTTTMEAMAAALPIVTTDAPGQRELVTNGENGFVVPRGNTSAIKGALYNVLNMTAEQRRELGLNGRRRCEAEHSILGDIQRHVANYCRKETQCRVQPKPSPSIPQTVTSTASGEIALSPHPTFSVVMPAYNMGHRGLERAIESVLAQTIQDWELIIVDDGSTDGSDTVMDWYAAKDPRIRVHHQDNRRLSATRNAGYWLARGEFVAHLDADDEYLPDKLERQLALFVADPSIGAMYGKAIYDDGMIAYNRHQNNLPDDGFEAVRNGNLVPCQSVVLRRSLLQTVGGNDAYTPCLIATGQDWDQWVRAFSVTNVGKIDAGPLYKLHWGDDRISANITNSPTHKEMMSLVRKRAQAIGDARRAATTRPIRVLFVCQDAFSRGAQQVVLSLLRHLPQDIEPILTLNKHHGELLNQYRSLCPVEDLTPELCEWADVIHYHSHGWTPAVDLAPYTNKLVVTRHSILRGYDGGGRIIRCWREVTPDGNLPLEYYPPAIEITNPVDFGGSSATRLKTSTPLILGLFPFQQLKGVALWLDAAERIHEQRPDCSFVIAGPRDGIDREYKEFSQRVKEMRDRGIDISYLPPQDRPTVKALCRKASVLMHLSHTEAMPLAMLEAQSEGTPVVCTGAGGMPQALYAGTVVPMNPDAAATAAIRLLGKRVPKKTTDLIAWRHDPRRAAASYAEVYRWTHLQRMMQK